MVDSVGGMNFMGKVLGMVSKKEGRNKIIDCGLGESSHYSSEGNILKILSKNKDNFSSYVTPTQGLLLLREGIAITLTKEFKKPIGVESLMVTPGSELALDLVYKTFLNPGDEIVIFDPFFIPFVSFANSYLAVPRIVDTYKSSFLPDLESVNRVINRKTKIIVVNSPNNPTGRVYPKNIIEEIVSMAKKRGIFILADEAYKSFDYNNIFNSPFSIYPEGTIVLRTFSKEYSMMGYKVGYILANEAIINKIRRIQYPGWGAPMLSSLLAAEALKESINYKKLTKYKQIRNFLYSHFKRLDLVNYLPEGAFYFYIKSPNNKAIDFAVTLAKKGLLVIPAFSKRKTHVRLSYGKLRISQASEAVEIIKEVLKDV